MILASQHRLVGWDVLLDLNRPFYNCTDRGVFRNEQKAFDVTFFAKGVFLVLFSEGMRT